MIQWCHCTTRNWLCRAGEEVHQVYVCMCRRPSVLLPYAINNPVFVVWCFFSKQRAWCPCVPTQASCIHRNSLVIYRKLIIKWYSAIDLVYLKSSDTNRGCISPVIFSGTYYYNKLHFG